MPIFSFLMSSVKWWLVQNPQFWDKFWAKSPDFFQNFLKFEPILNQFGKIVKNRPNHIQNSAFYKGSFIYQEADFASYPWWRHVPVGSFVLSIPPYNSCSSLCVMDTTFNSRITREVVTPRWMTIIWGRLLWLVYWGRLKADQSASMHTLQYRIKCNPFQYYCWGTVHLPLKHHSDRSALDCFELSGLF